MSLTSYRAAPSRVKSVVGRQSPVVRIDGAYLVLAAGSGS